MIAAAQVIFKNDKGDACLEWLLEQLPKEGVSCTRTEWRGYTTVVPQLLVAARPVAFTIQVDGDPEYVPGEIQELAEQTEPLLGPDVHGLAQCDTRLDVMSASSVNPQVTGTEVVAVAQTDVDPARPEVEQVLLVLAKLTSGFVLDCVNNRLKAPEGVDWVQL
jgi:hypothetical protein